MADREEALLAKAVTGDTAALSALLTECGKVVRADLANAIGSKWQSVLDADDVMQVTYLEAFLRIKSFKPAGMASFVGWVKRIAENNLQDAIKGLGRDKRPNPANRFQVAASDDTAIALFEMVGGDSLTPSRVAGRNERKAVLQSAITQLPADYQRVLQLYELEGRSVQDVASALKRTTGAVFMMRARAIERLREVLPSASDLMSRSS